MKQTTRLLSTLLVGTLVSFGIQQSSRAQTTLNYTNTADAWLTPASWGPANNWNSGAVRTNVTTANVRLNIGTNTLANQSVSVNYNASMGTTILNNAGVATRGATLLGVQVNPDAYRMPLYSLGKALLPEATRALAIERDLI